MSVERDLQRAAAIRDRKRGLLKEAVVLQHPYLVPTAEKLAASKLSLDECRAFLADLAGTHTGADSDAPSNAAREARQAELREIARAVNHARYGSSPRLDEEHKRLQAEADARPPANAKEARSRELRTLGRSISKRWAK